MQRLVAAVLLWAGLLLGHSAAAQMIHLKVDGVAGDSTVAGFAGWHPVTSWVIGESWPAGGTRATFEPLTITKPVGPRSPIFGVLAGTGQPIKEVVLDVRRSTAHTIPLVLIVLRDAVVRSHQLVGSSGSLPVETLAFAYGKIEWSYYPVNADGTVGSAVTARWDVVKNTFY